MAKVAIKNYMEKTDYFGWIHKITNNYGNTHIIF